MVLSELSRIVVALVFTIFIEFLVYAIFIRKDYKKLIFYSLVINLITNPLANLFAGTMFFNPPKFFLIEFLVFIVEIFLIKYLLNVSYKKAVGISLIANLLSFVFGFFLLLFIFW